MRMHLHLDDELVTELDKRVGPRNRSAYITAIIARAMDDERRWDAIQAAVATVGEGARLPRAGKGKGKGKAAKPRKRAGRKPKR